jgi:hypothetical protein
MRTDVKKDKAVEDFIVAMTADLVPGSAVAAAAISEAASSSSSHAGGCHGGPPRWTAPMLQRSETYVGN